MKLSYRWLGRHVDLSGVAPEEVRRLLTLHVCEVEGLEPFAPHLSRVTVGHVLERKQHPDADKLGVCQVDVGQGTPLEIVCGAANVAAGQKVAVATIGTELPGDFKIKKSKIRGVESHGMICSLRELALGEDHDGIWVLPTGADGQPLAVGQSVAKALGLDDHVLEIDNKSITHRPDLWGHRGMARELAAHLGRELRALDVSLPKTGQSAAPRVEIETEGCSRYLALPIRGVRIEASPLWLKLLLLAVGQRPIDVAVDVSNFVMLDLGQPNHLFDLRRVEAGIRVRNARAGESLTTLDESPRSLTPADLLICSGEAPVALAGIMGGALSRVAADTTDLLLEVANFHATSVRRTAARLALRTDSSARFEKSLDPALVPEAAGHLVRTLRSIQPGIELPSPANDQNRWCDPQRTIRLSGGNVRAVLGVEHADATIVALLKRLGFGVHQASPEAPLEVRVPTWRATKDITIAEDLIEEVGRSIGYNQIPGRRLLAEVAPPKHHASWALERRLQDRLAGAARFHEAPGYSFQSEDLTRAVRAAEQQHVTVLNPVLEGLSRVRRSVVPSLLSMLAQNLRQREEVRLFEVGKGYLPELADERGLPGEVREVGLVLARRPTSAARFDQSVFLQLRSVLDDLLRHLGCPADRWATPSAEPTSPQRQAVLPTWAHPKIALEWQAQDLGSAGYLAEVDPRVLAALGIEAEVAAARLDLHALGLRSAQAQGDRPRYQPIPRFPGVKLDVAFAAPESTRAEQLIDLIQQSGKGLVQEIELFDLYRGQALGADRKSLAFRLVLQAADRTLDEGDLEKYLERLTRNATQAGIELRRG
jgi:phenylalanyl-tRNA synthetase beta chain